MVTGVGRKLKDVGRRHTPLFLWDPRGQDVVWSCREALLPLFLHLPVSPDPGASQSEGSGHPSKHQLTGGKASPLQSSGGVCSAGPGFQGTCGQWLAGEEVQTGRLVLGHRAVPHSEMLRRSGRAFGALQARAKSFCGLGISDNLYPQVIKARG